MGKSRPLVYVVDDDYSVRKGLQRLIKAMNFGVVTFASANEFLERKACNRGSCLILDVTMPGLNGFELQERLAQRGSHLPIIFITGYGDIPMGVRAMKNGAVDFLPKPFDAKDIFNAIQRAINKNTEVRKKNREKVKIQKFINKLTPREFQVFRWVITGMLNKQIAQKLGIVEKTIKVHRGRLMHKMQVFSVVQLARLAEKVGIKPAA